MKKKYAIIITLITILGSWGVFAQPATNSSREDATGRDYRAALDIVGRITEISVALDERIWLTTYMGGVLYDQHFNCYSIALSRFIISCLTEDFYGREAFDNAVLLMKIGDYYCRKRW